MVNKAWGLLLGVVISGTAHAEMSYDDFMKEVGSAQQKIDHSKRLVNRNELDELIQDNQVQGVEPSGGQNAPGAGEEGQAATGAWMPELYQKPPESEGSIPPIEAEPIEQGGAGSANANDDVTTGGREKETQATSEQPKVSRAEPLSSDKNEAVRYVWRPKSSRQGGQNRNYSMHVEAPGVSAKFGIPIGTRIKVRLSTGASNMQPGYIQVKTLEEVVGEKDTLPRGSTIFLTTQAWGGTTRLFATSQKGITTYNKEFSVRGNIFGHDGKPGFEGHVVSDGKSFKRAVDTGLEAVGEGVLDAIPGNTLSTEAGKQAAKEILKDESATNNRKTGRLNLVVRAEPQVATLQIEETF